MKFTIRAAAILAGFIPGAATAAPFSYDCDTAAGVFSEIRQVQQGPAYAVAGRIVPRRLRTHERWLPSAKVEIEAADETTSVLLQLVPLAGGGSDFAIVAASTNGTKKGRTRLGRIALGESLAFSIRAAGGSVRIEAGGQSTQVPVSIGAGGAVSISCSTGEFDFEALDLEAPAG